MILKLCTFQEREKTQRHFILYQGADFGGTTEIGDIKIRTDWQPAGTVLKEPEDTDELCPFTFLDGTQAIRSGELQNIKPLKEISNCNYAAPSIFTNFDPTEKMYTFPMDALDEETKKKLQAKVG